MPLTTTLLWILGSAGSPLAPAPQDGGTNGRDDAWRVHEGVVGVVESRAITHTELLDSIFAPGSPYTVSTQEDFDAAREAEFTQAVRAGLRASAGEDLGIDPRMIDAHVDRVVSRSRRDLSAFEFRQQLAERGLDPTSNREEIREEVYQYVWELAVTGEGAAGNGRVVRDRYVRPGQLRAFYEQSLDDLRDPPPRVQLQVLTVAHASAGGADVARQVCTEQREEILAGKDFARVVEEYGAELRSTGGETGWLDPRGLASPELRRFALEADPLDLSPVVEARDPQTGQPVASQLVMLLERDPGGEPPPFDDPRVQAELRRRYETLLTNVRVQRAEERLLKEAYVWSLPVEGGPAAP